jgi:uncharacterized protein (DUF2141 family)
VVAETKVQAGRRTGAAALCCLAGALFAAAPAARAADILVLIDGVEPKKGQVFMRFCDKGPLGECQQYGAMQPALAETIGFRFTNIPPGEYAFVGFQDINGNGEADFNFVGMPKEPFTLSNGAGKKLVPPPGFDDAKVEIEDGPEQTVRMTMQTVLGGSKKAKVAMPLDKVPILAVLDPVPPPPKTK